MADVSFDRLRTDVRNRLLGDRKSYSTTFIDFYGLNDAFPGKSEAGSKSALIEKQQSVCINMLKALADTLDEGPMRRFIPYVQMHEFEGLLFSDPVTFGNRIEKTRAWKRNLLIFGENSKRPNT